MEREKMKRETKKKLSVCSFIIHHLPIVCYDDDDDDEGVSGSKKKFEK